MTGLIAGSIYAIITLCAVFIKPFRYGLSNLMKKQKEEECEQKLIKEIHEAVCELKDKMELQTKASLTTLRSDITRIYYKYLDSQRIPTYEFENLVKAYVVYHEMSGNSYIDTIYDEMKCWEIYK